MCTAFQGFLFRCSKDFAILVCPPSHAAPFCKSLIQGLEANPLSRIVWRGIKPLFIGKLLYTPDTPAVQQVMKEVRSNIRVSHSWHYKTNQPNYTLFVLKVNKTFEDLQILQALNESWMEVGPQIKTYMESSVDIQLLRVRVTHCHLSTKCDQCVMLHLAPKMPCLCACNRIC